MSDKEDSPASFHSLESDPDEFLALEDESALTSPQDAKRDEMAELRLKLEAMSDYSAEPPPSSRTGGADFHGSQGNVKTLSRLGECYSSGGYIDTYLTETPRRKPPDRKRQREISLTRAEERKKRESTEQINISDSKQEVSVTRPGVPSIGISDDEAQSFNRTSSEFVSSYQYFGRTISSMSPGGDDDDDEFRLLRDSPSEDFSVSHNSLEYGTRPFKLSIDELQDEHIDRVSREADNIIRQISATLDSTSRREQTFESNLYDFRDDEDPIFQKRFELDPGIESLSRGVSPSLRIPHRRQSFQQSGEETRYTTAELEDERTPSPEALTLRSKFSTVRRDSTMEKLETLLTSHTPDPSYFDTEAMEEISTYGKIRKIKKQRSEDQRILEEFDKHFDLCFEDSGEEDEFVSINDIDEPIDDASIPASFYSSMMQERIDRMAEAAGYFSPLSPRLDEAEEEEEEVDERRQVNASDLKRSREVFNLVEAAELEREEARLARRKSFYDELSDPLEPRRSIDAQTKTRALTPTDETTLDIPRIPRLESQKSDESHADSEMLFIPHRPSRERSRSPAKDEGIKTNRVYFEDIDTSELEEKAKVQRFTPFEDSGTVDSLTNSPRTPVKAWRAELNMKTGEKIYESERYGGRDRDPIYGEAFGRFPVRKFQPIGSPDSSTRRSRKDLSPRKSIYEATPAQGRPSYKQKFAEAPATKITSAFSAAVVDSDSYGDVGSADDTRTSTYPQKHEKRRRKQAAAAAAAASFRETSKDRFLRELDATPELRRRENQREGAISSMESNKPHSGEISPSSIHRVPSYELIESPSVSQSQDAPTANQTPKSVNPRIIRTMSAESAEEWSQSGYFVKPPKRTRSRNSSICNTASDRSDKGANTAEFTRDSMLAPSPPRRTRSRSRLEEESRADIQNDATRPTPPKRSRSSSGTRHSRHKSTEFAPELPKQLFIPTGKAAHVDKASDSNRPRNDGGESRNEKVSSLGTGETLSGGGVGGGVEAEPMMEEGSELNSEDYSDEEISSTFTVTFKPGGKIVDIEETPVQSSKSSSRRSSNSGADERLRMKTKRNQELLQRAIEGIDPTLDTDERFLDTLDGDQQLTPKVARHPHAPLKDRTVATGLEEFEHATGDDPLANSSLTPTPSRRELESPGEREKEHLKISSTSIDSSFRTGHGVGDLDGSAIAMDQQQASPAQSYGRDQSPVSRNLVTAGASENSNVDTRLTGDATHGLNTDEDSNSRALGKRDSEVTQINDSGDTNAANKRDPLYYSDTAETVSTASRMTAIERPRDVRNASADDAGYELVDTSGSYEKPKAPNRRRKSSATSGSAGNLKIMSQDKFGLVKPTYSDINDWARRALSSDDEMSSYHEDPHLDEHFDETLQAIDKMLATTPRTELDRAAVGSTKHPQISKYEELSNLREALRRKIEERQSYRLDSLERDAEEAGNCPIPERAHRGVELQQPDDEIRDPARVDQTDLQKREDDITSITGVYIGGIGELDQLTGGLNITRPLLEAEPEIDDQRIEGGNLLGGLLRGIRKSIDLGVAELRSITPRRQSSAEEAPHQPARGFFGEIFHKIQDKIVDVVAADDVAHKKWTTAGDMRLSSDKESPLERPKSSLSAIYSEVDGTRESSLPSALRPHTVYTTDSEMSVMDYEIRKRPQPRRRRTRDRIFDSSSDVPNSSTNEDFEPLFNVTDGRGGRAFIDDTLLAPKAPKRTKSATNLTDVSSDLPVPVIPKRTRSGSLAVPKPPSRTRSRDYLRSDVELCPPPLPPKNYQKMNHSTEGSFSAQEGPAAMTSTQDRWQRGKFTDQSKRLREVPQLGLQPPTPQPGMPVEIPAATTSASTGPSSGGVRDGELDLTIKKADQAPGTTRGTKREDASQSKLGTSRSSQIAPIQTSELSPTSNTDSAVNDQYLTFEDALSEPVITTPGPSFSEESSMTRDGDVSTSTTAKPVEEDIFYNALDTTPLLASGDDSRNQMSDTLANLDRQQAPLTTRSDRDGQLQKNAKPTSSGHRIERELGRLSAEAEDVSLPPSTQLNNYESYSDQKSAHEYELPEPPGAPYDSRRPLELSLGPPLHGTGVASSSERALRELDLKGQGQNAYYESTPGREVQHPLRPPAPGSAAADNAQPIYSQSMKLKGQLPPPVNKFNQELATQQKNPSNAGIIIPTAESVDAGDAQSFLSKLIPSRTKKKKRATPFLKIDKAELERLPTMRPASPSPTRKEFPASEEANTLQVPGQGTTEAEPGEGFTRRMIRRGSNALLELTGSFRRHRSPQVVEGSVPIGSSYQSTVVDTTDGTASGVKQTEPATLTTSTLNSSPSILRHPERARSDVGAAPEKSSRVQFISSPVHGRVLKSESMPPKAENDPLFMDEPTGPIVIDVKLSARDISFPVHGRKLKLATEGIAQPIRPTEESHLFSQYSDGADAFARNKIPDIDPRTQITGIGRGDEMRGQLEDEEFERDIFIPKQAKGPISLTRMLKGALTGKGLPWSSQLGGREWARKNQGRMELRKGQNSLLPSLQIGVAGVEAREIFGEEARLRRAQQELEEPKKVSKTVSFGDLMDIRQSFRNEELARMVAGAPPDAVLAHVKSSPYVDSMTMETIKKLLVPDFAKLRERIEEKLRKKIPKEKIEKNYQPFKFERGTNVPNEEVTYEREGPLQLSSNRNFAVLPPVDNFIGNTNVFIADLPTLDQTGNRNSVLAPTVAEVKRSAIEVIEEAARNAAQEVPAPLIPPLVLPLENVAATAPLIQNNAASILKISEAPTNSITKARKTIPDIPAPDIDLCNRRSSLILVNAKDLDLARPKQLDELTSVNVDLRRLRQNLPTYKQFKAAEV